MSSSVKRSVTVACNIEKAWQQVVNLSELHRWVTIHEELVCHDSPPLCAGFQMQQKLRLRGVVFRVDWELTASEEPYLLEWSGEGPAGSHAFARYELSQIDEHITSFTYTSSFKVPFGLLGKTASRLLVGNTPEHEAEASLQKLKQILERSPKAVL